MATRTEDSKGSATKLSGIRDDLLREHADLREKIADVRALIAQWACSRTSHREVLSELTKFRTALLAHNAHEEKALGNWIHTADAWGGARAEIMRDEHLREHSDLDGALWSAAALVEPAAWQYLVGVQLGRILDHMQIEERTFLNEGFLRDDCVSVECEAG